MKSVASHGFMHCHESHSMLMPRPSIRFPAAKHDLYTTVGVDILLNYFPEHGIDVLRLIGCPAVYVIILFPGLFFFVKSI
jgi:hypothetical protein